MLKVGLQLARQTILDSTPYQMRKELLRSLALIVASIWLQIGRDPQCKISMFIENDMGLGVAGIENGVPVYASPLRLSFEFDLQLNPMLYAMFIPVHGEQAAHTQISPASGDEMVNLAPRQVTALPASFFEDGATMTVADAEDSWGYLVLVTQSQLQTAGYADTGLPNSEQLLAAAEQAAEARKCQLNVEG